MRYGGIMVLVKIKRLVMMGMVCFFKDKWIIVVIDDVELEWI